MLTDPGESACQLIVTLAVHARDTATHWVGLSIGGSSLSKYGICRAFTADSLLAGFMASRPSATSIAAGDSRLTCENMDNTEADLVNAYLENDSLNFDRSSFFGLTSSYHGNSRT